MESTEGPGLYVGLVPTLTWSHSTMTASTRPHTRPPVCRPGSWKAGEGGCVPHARAGCLGPRAVLEVLVDPEANWGRQRPGQISTARQGWGTEQTSTKVHRKGPEAGRDVVQNTRHTASRAASSTPGSRGPRRADRPKSEIQEGAATGLATQGFGTISLG